LFYIGKMKSRAPEVRVNTGDGGGGGERIYIINYYLIYSPDPVEFATTRRAYRVPTLARTDTYENVYDDPPIIPMTTPIVTLSNYSYERAC